MHQELTWPRRHSQKMKRPKPRRWPQPVSSCLWSSSSAWLAIITSKRERGTDMFFKQQNWFNDWNKSYQDESMIQAPYTILWVETQTGSGAGKLTEANTDMQAITDTLAHRYLRLEDTIMKWLEHTWTQSQEDYAGVSAPQECEAWRDC
jgi:hypothetical protein